MSIVEYNLLDEATQSGDAPAAGIAGAHKPEQQAVRDTGVHISTEQLCTLARQLATLLRSGMPLVPALWALVEQLEQGPANLSVKPSSRQRALGLTVKDLAAGVNAGNTLSYAMGLHPDVFPPLFVNMVAAGEASGTLEDTLVRLADMLDRRAQLAAKVKAALAYPLTVTVVAVVTILVLLAYVVPSITEIFVELNRALPWPTRLLIAVSSFLRTYFVLIILAALGLLILAHNRYQTAEGRMFADRWKLKLPVFGPLLVKLEIARLTRTLGTLLVSGVPILGAIEIAKGVVQNALFAAALESVKDAVSKGGDLSAAIKRAGLFPPIVSHIISTGQMSGDLETGLANVADMYDREVEITVKTIVALLEPAVLVVMGLVVAMIVMAILLPILEINQML